MTAPDPPPAWPHPVAPADEVTAPWWEATRQGRLLVQRCPACDHRQHPPRAVCVGCGAPEPGWLTASGAATVDACTVVERPPAPDVAVPYLVARVRLAEGPILLSTVVGTSPYEITIGRRVRLAWRELPDGRRLPVFTVEES